jgi:hypothetical protein
MPLDWSAFAVRESSCPQRKPFMPKHCSERDRLREAYEQATLKASSLSGALASARFGREFSTALDKAKAASLACNVARRAFEEHCAAHGCQAEFHGLLWSTAS